MGGKTRWWLLIGVVSEHEDLVSSDMLGENDDYAVVVVY